MPSPSWPGEPRRGGIASEVGGPLAGGAGRGRPGRPVRASGPPARAHLGPLDAASWPRGTCSSPARTAGPPSARRAPASTRPTPGSSWPPASGAARGSSPSVVDHPQLFVTLTAPSFGPVHRSGESKGRRRACRPRRSGGSCPHGRPLSCQRRHAEGRPIGRRAAVPRVLRLPRRGAVERPRLAPVGARPRTASTERWPAAAGLSDGRAALGGPALLHQGGRVPAPRARPPPRRAPGRRRGRAGRAATALARRRGARPSAVGRPSPEVGVAVPLVAGTALRRARWGAQHDVRVLARQTHDDDATAIAAYVAKYATKTADGTPWLAHRIRIRAQIERLGLRPHIVAMVRTAWALGPAHGPRHLRLRDHAHTLGYAGQFSSKSVALLDHLRGAAPGPGRLRPRAMTGRRLRLRRRVALRRPGLRRPRGRHLGRHAPRGAPGGSRRVPAGSQTTSRKSSQRHDQGERAEKFLSRDESGNRFGNDPGNPMWRDGAMTHTPISQGSKALRSLTTTWRVARAPPRPGAWPRASP